MALPNFSEARTFYQAAFQRFEDAQFLLQEGRTTGAVYLAGYGVECMLKALILSRVARRVDRAEVLASFRGAKAHDFDWLKMQYLENGGSAYPGEVARHFLRVNSWTTDLRYKPGIMKNREAAAFLDAAAALLAWADGRL
jgi:hypothetical protein